MREQVSSGYAFEKLCYEVFKHNYTSTVKTDDLSINIGNEILVENAENTTSLEIRR